MHISEQKAKLQSGALDASLSYLYGEADASRERYIALCEEFEKTFGDSDGAILLSAPGRTELAGNHTDHQLGKVLCGAVTLDIAAAAASAEGGVIELLSDGFGLVRITLDSLEVHPEETGTTAALLRGVAAGFVRQGLRVGGFRACVHSQVPAGGGLSSSAAFEILIGAIFSALCNGGLQDAVTLAKIGQGAERDYFGKPSGLLDQTASACGGIAKIDFIDAQNPAVERIAFDFRKNGFVLCAVNTNTRHDDLTADYAAIPKDMTAVANAFGQSVLRFVRPGEFAAKRGEIAASLSPVAADRAEHFFAEDERVDRMAEALRSGDMAAYMENMNASGHSSRYLLRNIVPTAHPERTEVAEALDRAEALLAGKGAWRIHGGGFAGCIQCLVPETDYEAFRARMDAFYGEEATFELRIRPCGAYVLPSEG